MAAVAREPPSKVYWNSVMPEHIRQRTAKRKAKAKDELVPESKAMVYIENEGAVFRGPARGVPQEVWSELQAKFIPYKGNKDKPVVWGNVCQADDTVLWMKA